MARATDREKGRPTRASQRKVTPWQPSPWARRVLVADDARDAADSLSLVLRVAGHDAFAAYDGAAALRLARDRQPDVIVLDLGMPELDGSEVCREIRSESWGRSALVVALTGSCDAADSDAARAAGFDHYLVKPISPRRLLELIAPAAKRQTPARA
jgi:CheY-like chemotaxis protein